MTMTTDNEDQSEPTSEPDALAAEEGTPVLDEAPGKCGEGGDDQLEELLADELPGVRAPSPYDRPGSWFVVHTYAGYENKVKSNLESRISSMNMEDRIYEVVIPMEDVVEFKGGKKVTVQRRSSPATC